jgi:hypothetical protein
MADQRFHSHIVGGHVLADHDPRPGASLADLSTACTHIEGQLFDTCLASWFCCQLLPVVTPRAATASGWVQPLDFSAGNFSKRRNRLFTWQGLK